MSCVYLNPVEHLSQTQIRPAKRFPPARQLLRMLQKVPLIWMGHRNVYHCHWQWVFCFNSIWPDWMLFGPQVIWVWDAWSIHNPLCSLKSWCSCCQPCWHPHLSLRHCGALFYVILTLETWISLIKSRPTCGCEVECWAAEVVTRRMWFNKPKRVQIYYKLPAGDTLTDRRTLTFNRNHFSKTHKPILLVLRDQQKNIDIQTFNT